MPTFATELDTDFITRLREFLLDDEAVTLTREDAIRLVDRLADLSNLLKDDLRQFGAVVFYLNKSNETPDGDYWVRGAKELAREQRHDIYRSLRSLGLI